MMEAVRDDDPLIEVEDEEDEDELKPEPLPYENLENYIVLLNPRHTNEKPRRIAPPPNTDHDKKKSHKHNPSHQKNEQSEQTNRLFASTNIDPMVSSIWQNQTPNQTPNYWSVTQPSPPPPPPPSSSAIVPHLIPSAPPPYFQFQTAVDEPHQQQHQQQQQQQIKTEVGGDDAFISRSSVPVVSDHVGTELISSNTRELLTIPEGTANIDWNQRNSIGNLFGQIPAVQWEHDWQTPMHTPVLFNDADGNSSHSWQLAFDKDGTNMNPSNVPTYVPSDEPVLTGPQIESIRDDLGSEPSVTGLRGAVLMGQAEDDSGGTCETTGTMTRLTYLDGSLSATLRCLRQHQRIDRDRAFTWNWSADKIKELALAHENQTSVMVDFVLKHPSLIQNADDLQLLKNLVTAKQRIVYRETFNQIQMAIQNKNNLKILHSSTPQPTSQQPITIITFNRTTPTASIGGAVSPTASASSASATSATNAVEPPLVASATNVAEPQQVPSLSKSLDEPSQNPLEKGLQPVATITPTAERPLSGPAGDTGADEPSRMDHSSTKQFEFTRVCPTPFTQKSSELHKHENIVTNQETKTVAVTEQETKTVTMTEKETNATPKLVVPNEKPGGGVVESVNHALLNAHLNRLLQALTLAEQQSASHIDNDNDNDNDDIDEEKTQEKIVKKSDRFPSGFMSARDKLDYMHHPYNLKPKAVIDRNKKSPAPIVPTTWARPHLDELARQNMDEIKQLKEDLARLEAAKASLSKHQNKTAILDTPKGSESPESIITSHILPPATVSATVSMSYITNEINNQLLKSISSSSSSSSSKHHPKAANVELTKMESAPTTEPSQRCLTAPTAPTAPAVAAPERGAEERAEPTPKESTPPIGGAVERTPVGSAHLSVALSCAEASKMPAALAAEPPLKEAVNMPAGDTAPPIGAAKEAEVPAFLEPSQRDPKGVAHFSVAAPVRGAEGLAEASKLSTAPLSEPSQRDPTAPVVAPERGQKISSVLNPNTKLGVEGVCDMKNAADSSSNAADIIEHGSIPHTLSNVVVEDTEGTCGITHLREEDDTNDAHYKSDLYDKSADARKVELQKNHDGQLKVDTNFQKMETMNTQILDGVGNGGNDIGSIQALDQSNQQAPAVYAQNHKKFGNSFRRRKSRLHHYQNNSLAAAPAGVDGPPQTFNSNEITGGDQQPPNVSIFGNSTSQIPEEYTQPSPYVSYPPRQSYSQPQPQPQPYQDRSAPRQDWDAKSESSQISGQSGRSGQSGGSRSPSIFSGRRRAPGLFPQLRKISGRQNVILPKLVEDPIKNRTLRNDGDGDGDGDDVEDVDADDEDDDGVLRAVDHPEKKISPTKWRKQLEQKLELQTSLVTQQNELIKSLFEKLNTNTNIGKQNTVTENINATEKKGLSAPAAAAAAAAAKISTAPTSAEKMGERAAERIISSIRSAAESARAESGGDTNESALVNARAQMLVDKLARGLMENVQRFEQNPQQEVMACALRAMQKKLQEMNPSAVQTAGGLNSLNANGSQEIPIHMVPDPFQAQINEVIQHQREAEMVEEEFKQNRADAYNSHKASMLLFADLAQAVSNLAKPYLQGLGFTNLPAMLEEVLSEPEVKRQLQRSFLLRDDTYVSDPTMFVRTKYLHAILKDLLHKPTQDVLTAGVNMTEAAAQRLTRRASDATPTPHRKPTARNTPRPTTTPRPESKSPFINNNSNNLASSELPLRQRMRRPKPHTSPVAEHATMTSSTTPSDPVTEKKSNPQPIIDRIQSTGEDDKKKVVNMDDEKAPLNGAIKEENVLDEMDSSGVEEFELSDEDKARAEAAAEAQNDNSQMAAMVESLNRMATRFQRDEPTSTTTSNPQKPIRSAAEELEDQRKRELLLRQKLAQNIKS
jgi:hypothetical protein